MMPAPVSDERGITLVELLVGMVIGIAVLGAVVTLVTVTARSSGRITERVAADQTARPMVQRVMDALHSACIAPGLAPIRAGSDDNAITFIHGTGSAVAPTPAKRTIAWDPATTNLTDTTYAVTGGVAPDWTFASTGTSYRVLTRVGQVNASTPIFRYYAYANGSVPGTPLPVPLSAADAARAVQVTMSLSVSPANSGTSSESGAPVQITNNAFMRFSPSNEDTTQAGLPCT